MSTPGRQHTHQPHPHSYNPQTPYATTSQTAYSSGNASAPLPSPTRAQTQQSHHFYSIDSQGRIPPGVHSTSPPLPTSSHPHQQPAYTNGYPTGQYQQMPHQQMSASSAPAPAPAAQQMPQSQSNPHAARPPTYPPNAGTTAAETAAFLEDYGLVAEAAKRAQIACLMRDMEGVEL
ncbi:hypothetical protein P152DRAFT_188341 [Eremomyces bilateralis CBS 781.70]|uniref:Uncharacterized protein n=1 Tax=Eremomyces bilateralis CBS 781.70 TaxID=1392243 RepID=A0A6G1GBS0_9PEZI|nr:uncharacterized protein P152DRAFT_188341 [Eremomyces bilateralis CBS 781.70]KAF1815535.1 hypothetical protein P152DRAFT_188341 [Eremomyces bilateralis CBS 781.70]